MGSKATYRTAVETRDGSQNDDLRRLVRRQEALTRVATIVAEGVPAAELFAALTYEVAHGLEVSVVSLVRYEADRSTVVLASLNAPDFPVGGRMPLDGPSLAARVLEAGRPARAESELGSEVGVPIVVDGEVWGLIRAAATGPEPLRADLEASLRDFTELVATAISRTESRESLRRVVAEQAALRSVATLVAEGAAPAEVFSSVAREVARVLDVSAVSIVRFESDTWSVVLASFNDPGFPVGSRWPLQGPSLNASVFTTGKPAQIDYSELPGPVAAAARSSRVWVGVAVPIVVEGRVWGMLAVGQRHRRDALPAFAGSYTGRIVLSTASPQETQARLTAFTELVATAISKAQAHDDLRGLAIEQAALRRVATLVGEAAPSGELFSAVAEEVALVVGVPTVTLTRFEPDRSFTVVGCVNNVGFPVGSRWPIDGPSLAGTVLDTGRAARIDDYSNLPGTIAATMRKASMHSSVGVPIVVDGRVWGHLSVSATDVRPLPADTERRLYDFTELVGTAISKAESRDALRRLAEEEAALLRLATLVAEGVPSQEIFVAVSEEVAQLFAAGGLVLRYEDDGLGIVSVGVSTGTDIPVGKHWDFEEGMASLEVYRTGRSSRIDAFDWSSGSGPAADTAERLGIVSSVSNPILVENRLWGAVTVLSTSERLPDGTDDRLENFTRLVATAIANADSRTEVERLAEEQAALRRVATLVARDAPSTEVFDAVAAEVGKLFDTDITVVGRYDADGAATAIGNWSASPGGVPAGTRSAIGGRNVLTLVAEIAKPGRIDDYDDASGEAAEIARRHGWRSSIAAPIVVEGRLWGVMLVATQRPEPFPAGAEERLAGFTDLVATAIANAQAHDELRHFGDEQAALRRVATLVAAGAAPERVFTAVVEEVSSLLGLEGVNLIRYDGHAAAIMIAAAGDLAIAPGSRAVLDGDSVMATVARTRRAARIDDYSNLEGEAALAARDAGFQSAIGAPINVEGRLWGAIVAVSGRPEPIPEQSEMRLGQFTELVATAVANAESRAELAASRRRIVAASDETRRQIERDLHDGIQQRLVALGFAVRAAEAGLPAEREGLRAQLSGVATGLVAALEDLQEISRGIHPAILSRGGLAPALRTLAHRSPIPVNLDITADTRPAEPIEVAAYYVASEALANAAKHAQASRIDVSMAERDGKLLLSVRDDGAGGADAGRGSGLVGLTDRVEALGGRLALESPPGRGTTISVELPIATPATP